MSMSRLSPLTCLATSAISVGAIGVVISTGAPGTAQAVNDYTLGPDSQPRPGVPRGTVNKHSFKSQQVFPGTDREYWVYVPAQYDRRVAACVMVFQDGSGSPVSTASSRWLRSRKPPS
jgi:hypothetical protein